MKRAKFLVLGLLVFATGCRKIPDTSILSNQQVVATNRDVKAVFSNYSTFYISDTVNLIATDPKDSIITGSVAVQLVSAVKKNMTSRGYTFANRNAKPDLGLRLTVIKDVNRSSICGGYWDGWYGYYPWCTTYTYSVGTSTLYMYDLKNGSSNGNIIANWGATCFGVFSTTNNQTNANLTETAINQAYSQSPYIKK